MFGRDCSALIEAPCKMTSSDRLLFLAVTAMAGRLHLRDIGDYGPWDPTRIAYSDEQYVDLILGRIQARKVQTVEELDDALVASRGKPGSIDLYIHESLLSEVRQRWEEMRKALTLMVRTPQPVRERGARGCWRSRTHTGVWVNARYNSVGNLPGSFSRGSSGRTPGGRPGALGIPLRSLPTGSVFPLRTGCE